jgi:hypothetical protein
MLSCPNAIPGLLTRTPLASGHELRPFGIVVAVRPGRQIEVPVQPEDLQVDACHLAQVAGQHALVDRWLVGHCSQRGLGTWQRPPGRPQLIPSGLSPAKITQVLLPS